MFDICQLELATPLPTECVPARGSMWAGSTCKVNRSIYIAASPASGALRHELPTPHTVLHVKERQPMGSCTPRCGAGGTGPGYGRQGCSSAEFGRLCRYRLCGVEWTGGRYGISACRQQLESSVLQRVVTTAEFAKSALKGCLG